MVKGHGGDIMQVIELRFSKLSKFKSHSEASAREETFAEVGQR